jgi:hypothetical protein
MTTTDKTCRCPSCRTVIQGLPPLICPACNLGIPENSGNVPRAGFNPRNGFTGKEIMDRRGMPLDEYVKRLKNAIDE